MLIQIDVHYLFKKIKSVENYAVFNKILLLFFVSYPITIFLMLPPLNFEHTRQ